jgi:hypothetical protein
MVDPTDDGASEPTETIVFTITSGTGYTVGSPSSASITILDNDAQLVSVAKGNDAVENDGVEDNTDGKFVFTRIGDLSSSLTANFSVGGTATSGTDFTSIGTSVTFAAGSATADVAVDAAHDGIDDDDETVVVTVMSGTGYTVGSPSSDSLEIIDTDTDPDAYDGWETTSVNVDADVTVLDLATDLDEDELTVTDVTDGDHGSVVINLDGTVTYTPTTSYTGTDSFTYTVEDPDGNEATNTITISVGPIDPVALDDDVATAVNTGVNVDVEDVAFDPAGDTLTVTAVTQGTHGTVVNNMDGTFTYTPDTSYTGTDTFTYTVEDDDSNTATGTITVVVGPPAPTEVDGILDDLEDMQDLLDNYDEDTPDELLAGLPNVVGGAGDLLAAATTSISTNNIDTVGANKPFNDFLEAGGPSIKFGLYTSLINLKNLEALLWNLRVSTKDLLDSIFAQYKAALAQPQPNGLVVNALKQAYLTLNEFNLQLIAVWGKVYLKMHETRNECLKGLNALAKASPSAAMWLGSPPDVPIR